MKKQVTKLILLITLFILFVPASHAQDNHHPVVTLQNRTPRERTRGGAYDNDRSERVVNETSHTGQSAANSQNSILDQFGTPGKFPPAPGKFTQLVLQYKGRLPVSIRQKYGQFLASGVPGEHVTFSATGPKGHNYLKFTSLNPGNISVEDRNRIVRDLFVSVFPYGHATGVRGNIVELNNEFDLAVLGTVNRVQVTEVTAYSFTLTAAPQHNFKGQVTHGVFVDSDGKAWLYQEGIGDPSESTAKQWENIVAAEAMWNRMAENLNAYVIVSPGRRR